MTQTDRTISDDHEPEDAYDAGDSLPERLALLVRIVVAIREDRDRERARRRRAGALELVERIQHEIDDADRDLDDIRSQLFEA